MLNLLPFQVRAIEHVEGIARDRAGWARAEILELLGSIGIGADAYQSSLESIRVAAPVCIHFHPDRIAQSGLTVAEGLLHSGTYKTQFETGVSSGSRSAYAGGQRDQWEKRLFGRAYCAARVSPADRPRYGALQLLDHADGPAPRFGSSYFVLRQEVSDRCTFTFGGSHEDGAAQRSGTLRFFDPVLAPLLSILHKESGGLGVPRLSVPTLLNRLNDARPGAFSDPQTRSMGRALDSFIEVQVHGGVSLANDVEHLVADPAFRDHPIGGQLEAIATKFGISLWWHQGFVLPVSEVPEIFRGFPVRSLAERIAGTEVINPANLGAAANSVQLDASAWRDWPQPGSLHIQFRRLWHAIVAGGADD